MLSQKLSRITFKISDLQEYEDMKKKKKEVEKNAKKGVGELNARPRKTPRKALTFDTSTPTPSSNPDR